jgi:hypothetical protein
VYVRICHLLGRPRDSALRINDIGLFICQDCMMWDIGFRMIQVRDRLSSMHKGLGKFTLCLRRFRQGIYCIR